MPWKMGDVNARVIHNTKVLVRMLRNPLRRKNVLVMGNFPILAKSPTLGNVNDYFVLFKYLPNGQLRDKAEVIKKEKRDKPWDDELKDFLSIQANVVNSILKGILTVIGYFANFGTESLESISEKE